MEVTSARCMICMRRAPVDEFTRVKPKTRATCARCASKARTTVDVGAVSVELVEYLRQSRISDRNVTRIEALMESTSAEVRELAEALRDAAAVTPHKRRRLKILARSRPELLLRLAQLWLLPIPYDFESVVPFAVREIMERFPAPWGFAGGWAIELHGSAEPREHKDVDIAILREDQHLLHGLLPGWTFRVVRSGQLIEWSAGEYLGPPDHEIHAFGPRPHETSIEFLLNESEGDDWIFRRDSRIRMPRERWLDSDERFTFVNAGIVLLYKARDRGPIDETDFDNVLPWMSERDRLWLADALDTLYPGHPWAPRLRSRPAPLETAPVIFEGDDDLPF